jgi:hypothetical protein
MSLQKIREILTTEDTGDTEVRKEKQNPKLNVLSCKTLSFLTSASFLSSVVKFSLFIKFNKVK